FVLRSLHDWPELERIADQLTAVYEEALRQAPNDVWIIQARLYRIGVQVWRGEAYLRTGQAARAVALLERLPEQIAAVSQNPNWVEDRQAVVDDVSTTLGEVLLETGDPPRARSVLEEGIRSRETAIARQSANWGYQAGLAETCTLLARTLDPAKSDEALRHRQLLDRAAAILEKGESNGQLTADNKELLARIATMRTMASSS
ncbi:MAG TPA: hypothetical protein VFC28_06625, partial [Opitutaceae bacterium]|nr:hypothetical protein [Opitutaceae bacterium]